MFAIIKLAAEIVELAVRLHRPDLPLGRAQPGDVIADWINALTRVRDEMQREVGRDAIRVLREVKTRAALAWERLT